MSFSKDEVYELVRRLERMRTVLISMTPGNMSHHKNELEFLVDDVEKYITTEIKEKMK